MLIVENAAPWTTPEGSSAGVSIRNYGVRGVGITSGREEVSAGDSRVAWVEVGAAERATCIGVVPGEESKLVEAVEVKFALLSVSTDGWSAINHPWLTRLGDKCGAHPVAVLALGHHPQRHARVILHHLLHNLKPFHVKLCSKNTHTTSRLSRWRGSPLVSQLVPGLG